MPTATEKREALRLGLASSRPVLTLGAHDALTAMLAERHDFDAVWVSGFGVSTMGHALPDLNLIGMSETLEAARRMDSATGLPVVADCDNGFGGYGNVVRTVLEFDRAGIAGICIEDNTYPKRNSLLGNQTRRELVPLAEQARRLAAGKSAQESDDFVVIARVESLIAGHGVEDALQRATAYVEAGVDAILIHSRDKSLVEIRAFLDKWEMFGDVPLVAVPTLFPDFSLDELRSLGFNMVIYANQAMRASIKAIEETMAVLRREERPAAADEMIVPVDYVFDLVRTKESIAAAEESQAPR